ncbi:hypothetical protein RJ640_025292, partial [Escallonia rubra]
MVQLFLSEPIWSEGVDDESFKQIISVLNKLEAIIWSLLSSGGRSEARLWLCNTLSGMKSITPRHHTELFVNLLRSKPFKHGLAAQLFHMIFEKQPHKAGPIIAKKSYMLATFFRGKRILQWFSGFATSGDSEHKRGAKALSQFAFVNRDICWEELEWKGKHGQSPAMVATKPHYFLDLDVLQTVENFLEYVPEFFSSNEFAESLRDGEILLMDAKFFVNMFVGLMYEEDLKDIWEVVNQFLMGESFSSLCRRLLIVLEERDLCLFLKLLRKLLDPRMEYMDIHNPSYWLEISISKCSGSESIDQLLLLNAVVSQGRQLLRLIREEEGHQQILRQICTSASNAKCLTPILSKCIKTKTIESVKWLGLQSWALHYTMSEECQSPDSWQSLFLANAISFRKSDKYPLLRYSRLSEESESDLEERSLVGVKRKKKQKSTKKRRRNIDDYDGSGNELLDLDMSNKRLTVQSNAGSWLLSTDQFSTSLTT